MDVKVSKARWISTGIVEEVRKSDRKVRVAILPDKNQSNWADVYMLNAGNGYTSGVLPEVGTEVLVMFPSADRNNAIVMQGGLPQPGDAQSDVDGDHDWIIQDKSGNKIILTEGKIKILSGTVEIGESNLKKLINETFLTLFMNHIHIDPLSGFTGAVDPLTTIILPSHQTDTLRSS
jgi:hypothetical protein